MNYYQFNIGDYTSHTTHLEPLEDLAFRRMLDYIYLHEKPLPIDLDEIGKVIRMRTHSECIAYVLKEFFTLTKDGYTNNRATSEILTFQEKSAKASASANARWGKNKNKNKSLPSKKSVDANALRTECEGNAIQETINTKQDTKNNKKEIVIPDGINSDSFNEWLEFRKEKKKPVSLIAANKQFTLLAKYNKEIQKQIIDSSITNDWQGLFEPKFNKQEKIEKPVNIDKITAEFNKQRGII